MPNRSTSGGDERKVAMVRIYVNEAGRSKIADGKLEGFKVRFDNDGFPFVESGGGMRIKTPEKLQGFIEQISSVHHFPATPHRTLGEYRKGEVRVFLDKKDPNDPISCTMMGSSIEAIFELYCDIRAGKVGPTVSWEAEQKPAA